MFDVCLVLRGKGIVLGFLNLILISCINVGGVVVIWGRLVM